MLTALRTDRLLVSTQDPDTRLNCRVGELRHEPDGYVFTYGAAQEDSVAARQLLTAVTAWCTTEERFQRTRDDLIALGIPDEHPPTDTGRHPCTRRRRPDGATINSPTRRRGDGLPERSQSSAPLRSDRAITAPCGP